VKQRKPILIIDDSHNSQRIKKILNDNKIEFVEYNIKKFEESCCGELPTTKAPSVIAVEGIYKDEDKIKEYIKMAKENQKKNTERQNNLTNNKKIKGEESESSYW
jgi:hypothetical protein